MSGESHVPSPNPEDRIFVTGDSNHICQFNSISFKKTGEFSVMPEIKNWCRVIPIHKSAFPTHDDALTLAVSQRATCSTTFSNLVLYNFQKKRRSIFVPHLHKGPIWGLESICLPIEEFPRVLTSSGELNSTHSETGKNLMSIQFPMGVSVTRIRNYPDWSFNEVFLGVSSSVIDCWDVGAGSGVRIGRYVGHTDRVRGISADVERNLLFSSSYDGTAKLWDRRDCARFVESVRLPGGKGLSCLYSKNLLFVGCERDIEIWDARMVKSRLGFVPGRSWVYDMTQIQSGGEESGISVIAAVSDSLIVFFDSNGKKLSQTSLGFSCFGICEALEYHQRRDSPLQAVLERIQFLQLRSELWSCQFHLDGPEKIFAFVWIIEGGG